VRVCKKKIVLCPYKSREGCALIVAAHFGARWLGSSKGAGFLWPRAGPPPLAPWNAFTQREKKGRETIGTRGRLRWAGSSAVGSPQGQWIFDSDSLWPCPSVPEFSESLTVIWVKVSATWLKGKVKYAENVSICAAFPPQSSQASLSVNVAFFCFRLIPIQKCSLRSHSRARMPAGWSHGWREIVVKC